METGPESRNQYGQPTHTPTTKGTTRTKEHVNRHLSHVPKLAAKLFKVEGLPE